MWKKWKERFFALVQVFFSCGSRSFNHLLITKYRLLLPFGCVVRNIFESVDETLKCDHSSESYWAVLSCGTVYYAVQGGSNFWVCGWNPKVWPFKWKILSSIIRWYWLLRCTKVALTFESVGEILQCDHSNERLLSSSFLWYCLLCIIWFISKLVRFFSIYAIFLLYAGQPLHICNMQLSWKASWTNRNDGTSRLHCGLLWGNQWYVIKIHIETLQTALHTFLLRIVERIWFEIKVFSLW